MVCSRNGEVAGGTGTEKAGELDKGPEPTGMAVPIQGLDLTQGHAGAMEGCGQENGSIRFRPCLCHHLTG